MHKTSTKGIQFQVTKQAQIKFIRQKRKCCRNVNIKKECKSRERNELLVKY